MVRAISLLQPHATLVILREKLIETRGRNTKFRGRACIHASKGNSYESLFYTEPFLSVFKKHGIYDFSELPFGKIIGEVTVVNCKEILPYGAVIPIKMGKQFMLPPSGNEFHFGNYNQGRYGFELADIIKYDEPVAEKGTISPLFWPSKNVLNYQKEC